MQTSYTMMIITTTIILSAVMMIEGSKMSKAFDRVLPINTECSDTSQSRWFINDELAPPQWVQSSGNLLLPANNWRAYGIVMNECDSVNNTYEIVSLGEQCIGCLLQYFTPNRSVICVGDILTVTISTNQSWSHGGAFTLNVNSNVCYSGGGGGGIVSCREEEGSVDHHTTFSYYVTALNVGTAIIEAHTTYFEAEWYSQSVTVTITQCNTPPKNNTTIATSPNNTTDATNTTSPPNASTEQKPTSESGSGDGDDNEPPALSPTGDTPPSSVPVGDDENDNKYIIIPVISASVFVILVVVALFIVYKCCKKVKNKDNSITLTRIPANYGEQVAEEISLRIPLQEDSSAVAEGREIIESLPGNEVMGMVEERASSKASQESQC